MRSLDVAEILPVLTPFKYVLAAPNREILFLSAIVYAAALPSPTALFVFRLIPYLALYVFPSLGLALFNAVVICTLLMTSVFAAPEETVWAFPFKGQVTCNMGI